MEGAATVAIRCPDRPWSHGDRQLLSGWMSISLAQRAMGTQSEVCVINRTSQATANYANTFVTPARILEASSVLPSPTSGALDQSFGTRSKRKRLDS